MRPRRSGVVEIVNVDAEKRRTKTKLKCKSLPSRAKDLARVTVITQVTMDARINRDAQLKQLGSQSRLPTQTWYEWFWGIKPKGGPARAMDAATSECMRNAFIQMLDQTEPPAVFKPSEVALQLKDAQLAELGYEKWEEALPAVYHLAFEFRELGECVILRKGKLLPEEATIEDLDGPIRIGRASS